MKKVRFKLPSKTFVRVDGKMKLFETVVVKVTEDKRVMAQMEGSDKLRLERDAN